MRQVLNMFYNINCIIEKDKIRHTHTANRMSHYSQHIITDYLLVIRVLDMKRKSQLS